jgi:DNA polymerase I-like protein with 3'-5' exonuclease and polymerase domains
MKTPRPTTIDFETFGIDGRPSYPPMPVGVSIKRWGRKAEYFAFGHPTKNNACWSTAEDALREAYKNKDGILFQNGKFDIDVAEVWFNISPPSWDKIHDTMFLLFLDDPHQRQLGLKESAARLLDWPAEEQDAVGEWLIKHQPVPGIKISASKNSPHYFGRYIAYAPGDLVGKYANGDTRRTEALFKHLYPSIVEREMLQAYQREQRLMPILLDMERQGVPIDLPRLKADVDIYMTWWEKIDNWIIKRLKANINLDSGAQLMGAMIESGAADPDLIPLTPTGKYQTNKEALLIGVTDQVLLAVLRYRAQLKTCLNTFMKPWLLTAEKSKGLIFTTWNQVKAPKGGDTAGTRTGRLSSNPNFQNIPNVFEPIFAHEKKGLPRCPFRGLPPLPKVRSYIVPFKNEILIDRDYSQQELRILAHFDGGSLLEKYIQDPWMDVHDYAREELARNGLYYERKPVKNTNFGLIYGMGVGKLAQKNDMTVEESSGLKKAVMNLYPGLKEMYRDMKARAAAGLPIRTWGGREYYCEEPKIVGGRLRHFDYKMVNVLIQGSAADCTKEAIIRFYEQKKSNWKLLLNVHDQLTASVPKRSKQTAMRVLKETMESVEFDVPMLSEGDTSLINWEALEPYDRKGDIYRA